MNTSYISIIVFERFNKFCHQPLFQIKSRSWSSTISPLWKFRFLSCHFLSWSSWRNSFLQREENSFITCWIHLHLFQQYKSGFENSPGGGMTTLDFKVRMFAGESGNSLEESLIISTVRGLEFNIPSVSTISVNSKDSSSKALPWVCNSENKILQAECIYLSQAPPMWLATGGFHFHLIQSPPSSCMNTCIFLSSISSKALFNSFSCSDEIASIV